MYVQMMPQARLRHPPLVRVLLAAVTGLHCNLGIEIYHLWLVNLSRVKKRVFSCLAGTVVNQASKKGSRRTFKCGTGLFGSLSDLVGLCICSSHLIGFGTRNLAMSGLVVYTLDDHSWDRCAARSHWAIGLAHARSAAASLAVGDNFNFIRHCIVGSDLESGCSGNFAVRGLIVYTLYASGWNGRRRS